MKAPSEKHLEDWIVDHPQQLRKKAVSNPSDCLPEWDGYFYYIDRIIGRQVKLPSGICDLIALSNFHGLPSLVAIELKRHVIKPDDIAQCLRYMRDLNMIFQWTFARESNSGSPYAMEYPEQSHFWTVPWGAPEVFGILIGYGVAEPFLRACEAASILVLGYEYIEDTYQFSDLSLHPRKHRNEHDIWHDFSCGAIGEAVRQIIRDRSTIQK